MSATFDNVDRPLVLKGQAMLRRGGPGYELTTGYRGMPEQIALYGKWLKGIVRYGSAAEAQANGVARAAIPGTSKHGHNPSLAIDVGCRSDQVDGQTAIAKELGLIRTVVGEHWHFENDPSIPPPMSKEQVMGIAVAPRGSATREQGGGYVWGDRGHVYAFDGAPFCGLWDDPTRSDSSRHCVSLVPTATGQGYWLVSDRGEIYAYGDAPSANVHNYDVKDWGDFPIVGAFRNARVAKVGGLTLVRDDGKNLNKYELPA